MKLFSRGRQGHLGVNLTHGGIYRMHSVHRLVALTCIGNAPSPAHVVMHLDDDPTNNRPSNLCYGLPSDNSRQMVARGRQARGSHTGRAKLTETIVADIRRAIEAGAVKRTLAAQYGISATNVTDIAKRRIWRHV